MRRRHLLIAPLLLFSRPPPSMTKLVEIHNSHRNGPLKAAAALMEYAQRHAAWMASRGRMAHSQMSAISALGYSPVGENVAWGQDDEEDVMDAWMRSAGHRRNITNESFDSIGAGVAMAADRIYWCCVFGHARA